MPTDLVWWMGMAAGAAYSLIIGYRWGYRNGRKEGFRSGKVHGRYWSERDAK